MKKYALAILLSLLSVSAYGMDSARGWCEVGAVKVKTQNQNSSGYFQASYPTCLVTVKLHGSNTLATVYLNNGSGVRANPFYANADGSWKFYAVNGRYDITTSGANPVTLTDWLLCDPTDNTGLFSCGSGGTGGTGTVTSVDLSMPSIFGVSGNPITTAGTIVVTLNGQASNTFLAGPSGGGTPTFRNITSLDLPATVVYNNSANTYTTGLQDLSAATLKVPSAAGYAPATSGLFGYDSTNNLFVGGQGGVNYKFLSFTGAAPTGCATWSGNTLSGTGSPCPGGTGFANPMTTLGDIITGGSGGTATRLAGNSTTTPMYLKSTGTGAAATAPSWGQVAYTDISGVPQLAQTKTSVSHQWLNSYSATTGLFTATQPAWSDINSTPTTLAGYGITDGVPSTRTVNGNALSANVTLLLASSSFANQGTTTTVLHGNAAGNPSWGAVNLATDVTGNLPVTALNGGTGASSTTCWFGDATWKACGGGGGSGTVTVVGGGSLTSTALVTGGGTTLIQTPNASATMDTSGNISTPGTLTSGSGSGQAGGYDFFQGTTGTPDANSILLQAPTSVGTAYTITMPGAAATGIKHWTASGAVVTESIAGIGIADLTATGTPSSTTYLRGDNTWATPAGGGGGCTTCIDYTKHSEYNFVYRQGGSGNLALAYNSAGGVFSNSAWNVFSGTPTYGVRSSDANFNFYIEMGPGSGGNMAGSMSGFAGPDWYRQANTMLHVRFEPVTGTNARYWVGFSSCAIATLAGADNPVCNMVALLASTTTGNHNWYLVTSNSSTTTLTDTGVAWAAGTAYELHIQLGASSVTGTVNGTATSTGTTIPATSSAMYGGYILVTATSGVATTQARWDRLFLQSDN